MRRLHGPARRRHRARLSVLAVQAEGGAVETIEGVSDTGEVADLQAAFQERNALQCGYCTPGMLLAAAELLTA